MNIAIEKLDGENYSSWCVHMRSLLITADCWHVVESTCLEGSSAEKALFVRTDSKALALITLNIKASELLHIKGCKTSKSAWEVLKAVYNASGPTRKVCLLKIGAFPVSTER